MWSAPERVNPFCRPRERPPEWSLEKKGKTLVTARLAPAGERLRAKLCSSCAYELAALDKCPQHIVRAGPICRPLNTVSSSRSPEQSRLRVGELNEWFVDVVWTQQSNTHSKHNAEEGVQ